MSKAAKQSLIILIFLLLVALGFAGYIVFEKNKLEKEVTYLNTELDKADKREKEKARKIGSLNKEIQGLNDVKTDLEGKLQVASNKAAELAREVEGLNQQITSVTDERDKLNRRVGILSQETEKLNREVVELKNREPEVKIVYRDREVPAAGDAKKGTQQSEPRSAKSTVEAKAIPKVSADDEGYWAGVLKQKAELQVQIEDLKSQLSTYSLQVVELKQSNADLQLELDGLKHNKEEVEREIKYKTDLINNLSLELARSKNDKKFVVDRVDKLNEENKMLRSELKKLVSVKSSLEKSIVRLTEDKKKMAKQLEHTDGMIQSKIDEIWDIKESLDENFAASRGMNQKTEIELPPIVVNSSSTNEPAINFNYDQTTPGFDGRVVSINEDNNFIIVDVGESAGVRLGDTLSVYRDAKYIARLEVIQVRKDIAAADIKDQWARIKVGDVIR